LGAAATDVEVAEVVLLDSVLLASVLALLSEQPDRTRAAATKGTGQA
jgi:hypothetical protein